MRGLNSFIASMFIAVCVVTISSLLGCVSSKTDNLKTTPAVPDVQSKELDGSLAEQDPSKFILGTVAVTGVTVEHPSALLVYKANVSSDAVVRQLKDSGSFRVVDGGRLKAVLQRRNLEWSDLNENKDVAQQVRDVLLNDYFLQATISSYGEKFEYSSSAFSKSKTQVVNVTVDLLLKDAITNEILATAKGTGEERQQISQTLGFGAAGGVDTVIANAVLEAAIQNGISQITGKLVAGGHIRTQLRDVSEPSISSAKTVNVFTGNPKILFILSEIDDAKKTESVSDGVVKMSMAEHSMAKPFLEAKCKVLTADDVLNRAYSFAGGENILSGQWATEKDFIEVENLLQARSGVATYAIEVGKAAGADLIVSGEVRHQTFQLEGGDVPSRQSIVFLTAKAISVAKQKTLDIASVQQRYTAIQTPNELMARSRAVQIAAERAARDLLTKLMLHSDELVQQQ